MNIVRLGQADYTVYEDDTATRLENINKSVDAVFFSFPEKRRGSFLFCVV